MTCWVRASLASCSLPTLFIISAAMSASLAISFLMASMMAPPTALAFSPKPLANSLLTVNLPIGSAKSSSDGAPSSRKGSSKCSRPILMARARPGEMVRPAAASSRRIELYSSSAAPMSPKLETSSPTVSNSLANSSSAALSRSTSVSGSSLSSKSSLEIPAASISFSSSFSFSRSCLFRFSISLP
ncbi:hypothetical protein D3C72_1159500 [compost metagenome]